MNGERIYYPRYNRFAEMPTEEPRLYNAFGQTVHSLFFHDFHASHVPMYSGGRLLLDRYNFGLKHHLYTHRCMLETMGHPDYRYGALTETMGVLPDDYLIFEENPGLEKDFDRIFTYSKRLLNELPNAAFVPFCASVKLDFLSLDMTSLQTERLYEGKTRNISILSSDKVMCPLHALRIDTAKRMRRLGLADAFGTFASDLGYVRAYDTLAPYRFSIVFENSTEDYCFTEKLTNCFACQTIPIYIGPPSIGDYFNADGIIQVRPDEVNRLDEIIQTVTPALYQERLPAILDNYSRISRYGDMLDYLYDGYLAGDYE